MVDGTIKPNISLKAIATELANKAGTTDLLVFDDTNKMYFVNDATEDMIKELGFELLQYASNGKPIYKKDNIYAEPNTDPAFGQIMLYKEHNRRWVGEE